MKTKTLALVLLAVSSFSKANDCAKQVIPEKAIQANRPVASSASGSVSDVLTMSTSTTPCEITLEEWQRLDSPKKIVWDIRGRQTTGQPLPFALPATLSAIRSVMLASQQGVLLIGNALDLTSAHLICQQLRAHNHHGSIFVLRGGDRTWRAHTLQQTSLQRFHEAELSLSQAAAWLDDRSTEFLDFHSLRDSTSHRQTRSLTELENASQALRRIILFAPDQALPDLSAVEPVIDDRTWWVQATREMLESHASERKAVAMQRGLPLNRPCGVN